MSRRYRFRQVDVFTDRVLNGNPLAVFPEADGLTDAEMQALAREMNLSETAFVLPPTKAGVAEGADYRLRIFTPGLELPFAGHPSIGTAWVLADERRFPLRTPVVEVRQELAVGVLPVRVAVVDPGATGADTIGAGTIGAGASGRSRGGARRSGSARGGPAPVLGEVTMVQGRVEELQRLDRDEVDELCEALEVGSGAVGWRLDGRRVRAVPAVISTGLPHLIVPFAQRALMVEVDMERRRYVAEICRSLGCDSAALVAPGGSGAVPDAAVSVRLLDAGDLRIDADPATGAAAGPIAVFLGELEGVRDATHRVVIEQGTEVGRPSRLIAEVDFRPDGRPGEVRVSGQVVAVIEGWVTLPD
jgi:trans-2,3-dihydro-3-hydroxyanthranilate isomerase